VRCREKPLSEAKLKAQFADYFRLLTIPEPILEFLRDRLNRLDTLQGDALTHTREQREQALRSLQREERELLGLRMRQLIADEEFQRERQALQRRSQQLEQAAQTKPGDPSDLQARAAKLRDQIDLVHGGPLVVEKGEPFQLRSLLEQLQLEIVLRGRRLDFTAPKPLSTLVQAGSSSAWQSQWFLLWKWVMYGDVPASEMPSDEECRSIVAEQDAQVQVGGGVRRRTTCGRQRQSAVGSAGMSRSLRSASGVSNTPLRN
jgi:hypothetical protein